MTALACGTVATATVTKPMPTEVGALYLDHCLDILVRSEEADAAISSHAREPQGVLRVTLPNLYGQKRVAPLLPEFMKRYPKLQLELSFDDRYADLVRQRVDVGVRIGNLESGGYVARRLASNPRLLCAAPDYLVRQGRSVEVPTTPVLRADNAEALRQAALGGQGIALLATFVVEDDLRSGRLVRVLPEWSAADSWIFAVYPHARFLPGKARVFVDFLVETIGSGRGDPLEGA